MKRYATRRSDWDDGTSSLWVGPFNSGQTVNIPHIWVEEGVYNIKVKAKDVNDRESPWSDPLSVTIPRNKIVIGRACLRFVDMFPILERILHQLQ